MPCGLRLLADCIAAEVQASDGLQELQQTRSSTQQDPAVSRIDQAYSCYGGEVAPKARGEV